MQKQVEYMTTAHLIVRLEAVINNHKPNVTSIEAKVEFVAIAKEWMNRSEVTGIDQKFNVWNNVMAALALKYNLKGKGA